MKSAWFFESFVFVVAVVVVVVVGGVYEFIRRRRLSKLD